jgi:hypothetical protein
MPKDSHSSKSLPFATISEAKAEFVDAEAFRLALVADYHADEGRFSKLATLELMEACGIDVGNVDEFCISQVPTDRRAMLAGMETGWGVRYTYRIQGKARKSVRFQSVHGEGGVMESCKGPCVLVRRR